MSTEALLRSLNDQRRVFVDARGTYARRLAPDFNVFDFVAPGELKLSGILAWLLDPSGSHAQETLFLSEFLSEMGLEWASEGLETARVDVEAPTYEARRIDVVVRMPGGLIGIENKPFAADQPRQATDYLAWLDRQAPDGRLCLVYVGGSVGATPSDTSISNADRIGREKAGQFRATSYPELLPWLTRVRGKCEAPDVSSFLASFARYVESTFMGVRDMTERDALVRTATSSSEHLRSAYELIEAAFAIRSALLSSLLDQLRSGVPAGFEVRQFDFAARRYGGMSIGFTGVPDLTFCVEFEAGNVQTGDLHWLIYGVGKGDLPADPTIKACLDAAFGPGTTTPTWLWYRRATPSERHFPVEGDWRSAAPWLDVRDGTLTRKIIAAAEAVRQTLLSSSGAG